MVTETLAGQILSAAEALGYDPNPIAYSLKTNRSHIVGVLIPDLTNPVFPPIIRGMEDIFNAAGYTAILANTDNDPARERAILRKMLSRRVDGLILATARRDDAVVEQCMAEGIATVLINRTVDAGQVPSVVNDDALGIRLVVAHLVGLGHTRIAHIAGPLTLSTGFARRKAFTAAMKAHGLKVDSRLIVACAGFREDEGRRAFLELWARERNFTAVVAGNDLLALGCYDAAAELGLHIPAEMSVTGYNDMPFLDKLHPPLTTLRIPHYEMGTQAAKMLLGRMQKHVLPASSIALLPELVVRGSTAPVPATAQPARRRTPVGAPQ